MPDPQVVYYTATSLDGFIADPDNSLAWLFAADSDKAEEGGIGGFLAGIGVLVMGSTTYEWVLREENLLEDPARWRGYYDERPAFVFTSRELPAPEGIDIRFARGSVAGAMPEIAAAAGDREVWVVGGGDLAGQFFDADLLDRVEVSIAPVTLGAGAPLLPRRIESDRLRLVESKGPRQFVTARYEIVRPG